MPNMAQVSDVADKIAPTSAQYPIRYPLTVTVDMDERIQQVLSKEGREVTRNDLLRRWIREGLDNQEDVIGSRRHFSRSLQNRFDGLESTLVFYLNIVIFLIAGCLATILQIVMKNPKVQSSELIKIAVQTARTEGPNLNQQLQAYREQHQL